MYEDFEKFIKDLNIDAKLIILDDFESKNEKKLFNYHKDHPEQLLIFEDWWLYKQDIIKSVLSVKSGKSKKYYARKLKIQIPNIEEEKKFLIDNHLQGYRASSIRLGLYDKDELIQIITFSKARYNYKVNYELLRLATKKYCTVVGGVEKLWKYFLNNYSVKDIVSYSDDSLFNGNIYKKLGFEYNSRTIGYTYYNFSKEKPKERIHRTYFQKSRLNKIFNISEEEVDKEYETCKRFGLNRIWDCGQTTWIRKTSEEIYKHYYIYEIKNNINGKTYIGQHRTNNINDGYFGSEIILRKAITKYGKENFEKTILEECSEKSINEAEIKWITEYKKDGRAEYNVAEGGASYGNPFAYKTEEEMHNIFKNAAEMRKNKPSGIAGKRKKENVNYLTEGEHNVLEQPCKTSISIICEQTGRKFSSLRECADVLKVSHEAVSDYISGERNIPVGGYTFKNIGHEFVPYVIIMETEQTFETITDCAKYIGCSKDSVIRNVGGKTKQCLGYHICYFKNYDRDSNIYLGQERYATPKRVYGEKRSTDKKVKAININTNEEIIFNSIGECCKQLGVCRSSVSNICNKVGGRNKAKNYTFEFV